MNRVYDDIKKAEVDYVVRVECSEMMNDYKLSYQLIDAFIRDYQAEASLINRVSPQRLQRLIQDYSQRNRRRRIIILIDEADLLMDRCPEVSALIRRCHNEGWARFILLGFQKLKEAIDDRKHALLGQLLTALPLTGLTFEECGSLVTQPMAELQVKFHDREGVVRRIYEESGASPSRIQLLCHFIVDSLAATRGRTVDLQMVDAAVDHSSVQKFFNSWFFESTSEEMRWLAAASTLFVPCSQEDLVEEVAVNFHGFSGLEIKDLIQRLVTADILQYRADKSIDFSFPAMKAIATPRKLRSDTVAELRHMGREIQRMRGQA